MGDEIWFESEIKDTSIPAEESVQEQVSPAEEIPEQGTAVIPEVSEIACYMPNELNINYLGEWVVKIGNLCYWISVRGKDNKVMITYNIDPDGLHPDHFTECSNDMVPWKILDMFQKKLSTDIMRLDSMMNNLITNKGMLNRLFNFAETNKTSNTKELAYEVSEYTEEDAHKDKELETMKAQNQTTKLSGHQKKARAKKKTAKKAKKKSKSR